MKKIYTFTLQNDKRTLDQSDQNLRLLAYMLYESIYNYYGDGRIPLDISDGIRINKLVENGEKRTYMLESEVFGDNICYDPFLIGENSFGLTISDSTFDGKIIERLLRENLRLLKIDTSVKVVSFRCEELAFDDLINREETIKKIYEWFGCKQKKSSFLGMFKNNKKGNR